MPHGTVVHNQALAHGPREQLPDCAERVAHRQENAAHTHHVHRRIRQALADEKHDRRARQRKQRDQPDMREKIFSRHG
jgi:hypothetical protein